MYTFEFTLDGRSFDVSGDALSDYTLPTAGFYIDGDREFNEIGYAAAFVAQDNEVSEFENFNVYHNGELIASTEA